MLSPTEALKKFKEIFIQAFKEELSYQVDVNARRIASRTDPRVQRNQEALAFVSTIADATSVPGVAIPTEVLSRLIAWKDAKKQDKKAAQKAYIAYMLAPKELDIRLMMAAEQVAKRYQSIIILIENEVDIIKFARIGAQRALDYLCQPGIMDAFKADDILCGVYDSSLGEKDKVQNKKFTVDGMYRRIAWCDGQVFYIVKGGAKDYRTNMHGVVPKYGYAYVDLEWRTTQQNLLAKYQSRFSKKLTLKQMTQSDSKQNHFHQKMLWATVNRVELEEYLTHFHQKTIQISLLQYIQDKRQNPNLEKIFYVAKTSQDLDLASLNFSGVDCSYCVFDYCIFGGSLDNTKWQSSGLRYADFKGVTSIKEAIFYQAQLEHLKAPGIEFNKCCLSKADFCYADLDQASLINCDILGIKNFDEVKGIVVTIDMETKENIASLKKQQESCRDLLRQQAFQQQEKAIRIDQFLDRLKQQEELFHNTVKQLEEAQTQTAEKQKQELEANIERLKEAEQMICGLKLDLLHLQEKKEQQEQQDKWETASVASSRLSVSESQYSQQENFLEEEESLAEEAQTADQMISGEILKDLEFQTLGAQSSQQENASKEEVPLPTEEAPSSGNVQILKIVERSPTAFRAALFKVKYDRFAILVAAGCGHLEVVEWLLSTEGGTSLARKDNHGRTALLWAAQNGRLGVVQCLLSNGASIKEQSQYGRTALLLAAEFGHLEVVEWLLKEGGVSLNEKDNQGCTALSLARENNHVELVEWLSSEESKIGALSLVSQGLFATNVSSSPTVVSDSNISCCVS